MTGHLEIAREGEPEGVVAGSRPFATMSEGGLKGALSAGPKWRCDPFHNPPCISSFAYMWHMGTATGSATPPWMNGVLAEKSPAVAAFQVQLKLLKFRAYLATTIDRRLSPSTNLSTRILV